MIAFVDGEIFNLQIEGTEIPREMIEEFFTGGGHENDLICVIMKRGKKLYINKNDFIQNKIDDKCVEVMGLDVFERLRMNPHIADGVVVEDEAGNPVAIARYISSYYNHEYGVNLKKIDRSVLELYDCICMEDMNEYSFLMLREVLADYKGRIILKGVCWEEWRELFSEIFSKENVFVAESPEAAERLTENMRTMQISYFLSNIDGYTERCNNGIFSYDEIMLLLYLFTDERKAGNLNKGKRFYVMDGRFAFQGLISICDKLSVPCAYIKSKGYIPIIRIKSSLQSLYCDFPGDDIWSKFFVQPGKYSAQAFLNSASVTFSSNFNLSFSGIWLMEQIAHCGKESLVGTKYFNYDLKKYVDEQRRKVIGDRKRVLGVLVRGTDYVVNKTPGHTMQAPPEMVMDKVDEWDHEGQFDAIYLATEDEGVLYKMAERYGDRLLYTDQKRFTLHEGQYLFHLEHEREKEGMLKGFEYLASITLLSECAALIASGDCAGVGYALAANENKYEQTYIFRLGTY